jgi:hypothetical protein
LKYTGKDNTEMDFFRPTRRANVEWIHLAQGSVLWEVLVNMLLNLRVLILVPVLNHVYLAHTFISYFLKLSSWCFRWHLAFRSFWTKIVQTFSCSPMSVTNHAHLP